MKKKLNTRTNKYLSFQRFILDSVKDASRMFVNDDTNMEGGWLFNVYQKGNPLPMVVKIDYDMYTNHKGEWSSDLTLSDYETRLYNGWIGHEVVLRPIGEMLLKDI